jgi:predicted phosphodiesterase
MRVAALYDIHANLPALEAVLAEVRAAQVDLVVVGGDVLPGPMPRASLELLLHLDIPTRFILGNGDREVLAVMRGREAKVPAAYQEVMRWNAAQLGKEHEAAMAAWPATLQVGIEDLGEVLFCHATPRDDNEIFVRTTAEERLAPIFGAAAAAVVVCGHTHMQFDRAVGATRVVNAGSVGMPFGEPGAYWLLLESSVDLRRTAYDLGSAAAAIRKTSYPQAGEFVERNLLHPPTEADMMAAYARVELR